MLRANGQEQPLVAFIKTSPAINPPCFYYYFFSQFM